jgi:hypothetical protein
MVFFVVRNIFTLGMEGCSRFSGSVPNLLEAGFGVKFIVSANPMGCILYHFMCIYYMYYIHVLYLVQCVLHLPVNNF